MKRNTDGMDKSALVKVKDYIPDIFVDLKYATKNNFTGRKIYTFTEAYLRQGTVEKLQKVQEELRRQGLSLKIWDAYRPVAVQFIFWKVCPDDTYVVNPYKGFSTHSMGCAVDCTLVTVEGRDMPMPTEFDDFSELAGRHKNTWNKEVAANAILLKELMTRNGFHAYENEWWHYDDIDVYPVIKEIFV